jgi:hypothetical protein
MPDRILRELKNGTNVDPHQVLELLQRMIDKGLGNVHACVIHQNIQLGMTINSKRKEILYLRGSAEIGSKKRHIHCILIKTRRCLFQRI